jgi:hypothetical protein
MQLPSVDAETAVFHANGIRALFAANRTARSRRRRKRRQAATERLLIELSIGRTVGFAELYLHMRAVRKLKPQMFSPAFKATLGDKLIGQLQKPTIANIKSIWKKQLKIDLERLTTWNDFDLLRELRHVLVHSLGAWEPVIDPKPKLAARIRAMGLHPDLYRGPVPLDRSDLDNAIKTSLALLMELDPKTLR